MLCMPHHVTRTSVRAQTNPSLMPLVRAEEGIMRAKYSEGTGCKGLTTDNEQRRKRKGKEAGQTSVYHHGELPLRSHGMWTDW